MRGRAWSSVADAVVERELRAALRSGPFLATLLIAGAAGALLRTLGSWLLPEADGAQMGLGSVFVVLAGSVVGATTLSVERQNGTLDLLRVSGARARDVVLGHARAAVGKGALLLTVLAPLLLVPPRVDRLDLVSFALVAMVPYALLVPAVAFGMSLSARLGTRAATALAVLGAAVVSVVVAWGSADPRGWWVWALYLSESQSLGDLLRLAVVPASWLAGGTALLFALAEEPMLPVRERGRAVRRVALAVGVAVPMLVGLQVGAAFGHHHALRVAGSALLVANVLLAAWALLARRPWSWVALVPLVSGAVVLGVIHLRWGVLPDRTLGHVAALTVTASALLLFVSGLRGVLSRWASGYAERLTPVVTLVLLALVPVSIVDLDVAGAPDLAAFLDQLSPVRPFLRPRTWQPAPPLDSLPPFVALYGLPGVAMRPFAKPAGRRHPGDRLGQNERAQDGADDRGAG